MNEDPQKVVGYIRVSTKEQASEGVSLAAQRSKIENYVAYKGYELVELVADEGVSASKPLHTREGGIRVLEMADSKSVTAVIACKLDRLFRDALDCLEVTRRWDKHNVSMHLLDISLDTSTPYGRFFMTSIVAFAELERNMIGERIRVGMAQIKAEGYQLGAPAFGQEYIDEDDHNGRRLMGTVAKARAIIKEMVDWRRTGLTYEDIAEKLNSRGIPTQKGRKWHRMTVYRILKRIEV